MKYKHANLSIKFKLEDKIRFTLIIISFLILGIENLNNGFRFVLTDGNASSRSSVNTLFSILIIANFFSFLLSDRANIRKFSINIILAVFSIYYFFVYGFTFDILTPRDLLSFSILILWVFSFMMGQIISKNEPDKLYRFVLFFSIFTIIPILVFTYFFYIKYDIASFYLGGNDVVFYTIVFFPFVFLLRKNKLLRLSLIIAFLTISLMSAKRSIIISSILAVIVYYLLISNTKQKLKQLFSWYSILLIGIFVFVYNFLKNKFFDIVFQRFENLERDGGSGRDSIYDTIINAFNNSNSNEILFGHGFQSTRNVVGVLAHNDSIQILFDFGILGLSLYYLFLFFLIIPIFTKYKYKKEFNVEYAAYAATIVMFLILSMSNCFIYSYSLMAPLMLAIGILYQKLNRPVL